MHKKKIILFYGDKSLEQARTFTNQNRFHGSLRYLVMDGDPCPKNNPVLIVTSDAENKLAREVTEIAMNLGARKYEEWVRPEQRAENLLDSITHAVALQQTTVIVLERLSQAHLVQSMLQSAHPTAEFLFRN